MEREYSENCDSCKCNIFSPFWYLHKGYQTNKKYENKNINWDNTLGSLTLDLKELIRINFAAED
jgi:hypothetical protein